MARRKIHISNLTVRLPRNIGWMSNDVRNMASGLGREILSHIAVTAQGHSGMIRIDTISAGTIRMTGSAGEIQRQIGARVAEDVAKKLGGGGR